VVIAITSTPVRYKRNIQFLTSAPNFRGGVSADPLTFPSPWEIYPSHVVLVVNLADSRKLVTVLWSVWRQCDHQGSFRGATRGNVVPIVEKLVKRTGTALPLLRKHYGRHWEPFSGQNALDCRILRMQSQVFFRGRYPRTPRRSAPSAWTQNQFLLGSPVFPLFLL